jgi:sirohydrochlorin cobaltochelatase
MMRLRTVFFAALCLLMVTWHSLALAAEAAPDAILLVAFGTSVEKARVSYENVEKQVKAQFPGKQVRWAWTAQSLLKTAPEGKAMLSPQEALARLATEGVKDVAILSLHIIPGAEYGNLERTALAFVGLPKGLEQVKISRPLLYDTESVSAAADLLLGLVPKERKKDEAVLFVGHGTHHPAGVYYPALQYYLGMKDKNAFVGTVEGDLDLEGVTAALKAGGIKKVWLAPLMTVAGDHATNDLFGDEPDSWKKHLSAQGITVIPMDKGLGEYPQVVARWVEGLKQASEGSTH